MTYRNEDIVSEETIWFPGIYGGRTEEPWTKHVSEFDIQEVIALVQERAEQDGTWAIENGFVGDNEDKMRKMMAWVSDEDNIRQCVQANLDQNPTVDWVARDLANGSKWVAGSRG